MGIDKGCDDRPTLAQPPPLVPPVVVLSRQTPGLTDADSIRHLLNECIHLPLILVLPPESWHREEQQALQARIKALFDDAGTLLQKPGLPADHGPEPSREPDTTPVRATPPSPHGGLANWQIRRLTSYLEEHLSETIHVQDLSALIGLSPGHFAHAFKQSFDESPLAHVTRRRLERACELMLTSDESLSSIARDCGFCDQSHFTRHFHRTLGMAPQHWRRLHSPGPHQVSDPR